MHYCPCCDQITFISEDPTVLCEYCQAEGCEPTTDASGDLAYHGGCQSPHVAGDEYYLA